MLNTIQLASKSDSTLAKLLNEARDYAYVYVLARQRQKGCDGLGEMTNLKDELRNTVDKMILYAQDKKYISEIISYDIDSIAEEILKG